MHKNPTNNTGPKNKIPSIMPKAKISAHRMIPFFASCSHKKAAFSSSFFDSYLILNPFSEHCKQQQDIRCSGKAQNIDK